MRISDWSSDVCSSDLRADEQGPGRRRQPAGGHDHPVRRDARVLRRKEQPEAVHGDAGVLQAPHRRPGGRRSTGTRKLIAQATGEPGHRLPVAPQTDRSWARISPYAGGLRYNDSTPANKRRNHVNIPTPGQTMRVLRSALLALALLPLVAVAQRSEEHPSELQSLMRISYAVFCLKKKKKKNTNYTMLDCV